MNQRERIAKAMYEAPDPDQTESTTPWPPSHPEDLAWWLSRAEAALAVFEEAHTPANVSEPGKTDTPSAPLSLSGQIPTDDEREVLVALKLVSFSKQMEDGYPATVIRDNEEAADLVLAAGFHRTMQGEHQKLAIYDGNENVCVTCPRNEYGEYVAWDQAHPFKVQGEPSDAAVQAALIAYWGGSEKVARFYGSEQGMRAALRAAAAVQGGGTR